MMAYRARQIMDSLGVIEVKYQGNPVWIEQVEEDSAMVRFLDSGKKLKVPVNMLAEGYKPG